MQDQTIRDDQSKPASLTTLVERLATAGASTSAILMVARAFESRQRADDQRRAKAAERKRRERARKRDSRVSDISTTSASLPTAQRDSRVTVTPSKPVMEPTSPVASASSHAGTEHNAIACPCCGGDIAEPSVEVMVDVYRLPPQQEIILRTAWKAKGHPVPTIRFIDAMYADDPNGGPSEGTARRYFKTQLCLLRARIEPSGVRIETLGYGRGYRLQLDRATPKTSKS